MANYYVLERLDDGSGKLHQVKQYKSLDSAIKYAKEMSTFKKTYQVAGQHDMKRLANTGRLIQKDVREALTKVSFYVIVSP